jgi:23S rRNA (guanosine2251-2'-O)-methyltransferase
MTAANYQIRVCENPACGLRYPLVEGHPFGERCPFCLGSTKVAMTRPLSSEPFSPLNEPNQPRIRLHALLDNVRSAWNVGAIFRTADCLGVEKLYLGGITPTPENEAVRKTSLGAEETVKWEAARDAVRLAERLKAEGATLWALEQDERAVRLNETEAGTERLRQTEKRMVLIVGNEVTGVEPGLLDLCEKIAYIPMLGNKRSLNVEVAFGIAAWELLRPR